MTIQRILIEEKKADGILQNLYYRNCVPLEGISNITIDNIEYKIISREQILDTNKGILETSYIVERVNKLESKKE